VHHYEKAIECNPQFSVARYHLATLYEELNDAESALKHFEKAAECNPHDKDVQAALQRVRKLIKNQDKRK